MLLVAGCSLPKAPADLAWDTHLILPFGVSTYGMNDLVSTPDELQTNGSGIGIDSTGLLYFSTFTEMEVPIKDSLVITPIASGTPSSPDPQKPTGITEITLPVEFPAQQHRLTTGLIESGSLTLQISNLTSALPESITVIIPNFKVDQFDNPLTVRVVAASGTTVSRTVQLAGDSLTPSGTTPQSIDVRILAPGSIAVRVHVQTTRILFSYYVGVVNGLVIHARNASTSVKPMPEGWEAIHPVDVQAFAHILPGMDATTDVSLTLHSSKNGNLVDTAHVTAANIDLGTDTTLVRPGLAGMIAQFPDTVEATGFLTLHGPIESLVADSVKMEIEMRSALAFTLDTLVAPGETRSLEGGNDAKDIQSGSMKFRIWNRLPVGGRVVVYVGYSHDKVFDRTPDLGDSVYVLAEAPVALPTINPTTGRPTDEEFSEFTTTITDDLLNVFKADSLYTRTEVRLGGSDGEIRRAYGDDYVKVQVIADILYRIDTASNDNDEGDN